VSKLTAVAYYAGIPPNNKNLEKPLILDNFLAGVQKIGDTAIAHQGMNALPCDVALIQGFVHEHGKTAAHLQLRQDAIDLQKKTNRRSLIVDSNLFLYADPGNTKTYLRYSFDGVFPTTGFYFDQHIEPTRWTKISQDLNISLKPWRTQGDHILICLQRHGGWSMAGLSVQQWLDQTIAQIRQYSRKRQIVVRTHPGDKKIKSILNKICPSALGTRKQSQYGVKRAYVLPTLEVARKEFANYLGGVIDWQDVKTADNIQLDLITCEEEEDEYSPF
jgi:hypothetical protein